MTGCAVDEKWLRGPSALALGTAQVQARHHCEANRVDHEIGQGHRTTGIEDHAKQSGDDAQRYGGQVIHRRHVRLAPRLGAAVECAAGAGTEHTLSGPMPRTIH